MKHLLPLFASVFLFISCSKKDDVEPVTEPTNELVGTTWERTIAKNSDLNIEIYDYIAFKTATEVEYSSKYSKTELRKIVGLYKYTLDSTEVVYKIEGFNYTGVISGDTMTVMGTEDYLIYIKIK